MRPMAHDLLLIRREADGMATRGELHLDPGPKFLCYTLENAWRNNEPMVSCIPTGRFPLRLRTEGGFHERYRQQYAWHRGMVEVVVPGRTFILFHKGNYHRDTHGCILPGIAKGTDYDGDDALTVWQSGEAYRRIYRYLHEAATSGGHLTVMNDLGEAA